MAARMVISRMHHHHGYISWIIIICFVPKLQAAITVSYQYMMMMMMMMMTDEDEDAVVAIIKERKKEISFAILLSKNDAC